MHRMQTLYRSPWWTPLPIALVVGYYLYRWLTDDTSPSLIPMIGVLLFAVILIYRMANRRIEAGRQELKVTNLVRTWRIPWDKVIAVGPEMGDFKRGYVDFSGRKGVNNRVVLSALPAFGPARDEVLESIDEMRKRPGARPR